MNQHTIPDQGLDHVADTARDRPPLLHAKHVQIGYETDGTWTTAVEDASFEIHTGETIILLGPSGCGKSTLLKAIAGFIEPSGGRIEFDGRTELTPGPDRAVVFQEFDQLFPWRTVLDNVAYPLRRNGRAKRIADATARRFLDMAGLSQAIGKYPHQLSGGMKQRVAIARALALEPDMLLMDEPFGALDALTRARLQRELNQIARATRVTILFVTHSIEEAIILGDRVVVLANAPSYVRDVVAVSDETKRPDTQAYLQVRSRLHALLSETEEETNEAFFD